VNRMVNWYEEVLARKEDLLNDLVGLLKIESIKDESTKTSQYPMGTKVGEALDYMLSISESSGLKTKNVDGYAGYAEMGEGNVEDTIGVLCHVDVVPATGEWTSLPFEPTIRDGKLYARGAIDDKGPTIAAFYGVKIVKELGLPLQKRVRIIFGTDEESGMSCMKHYQQVEQMPSVGFAPDADFPIINAEKGQLNVKLTIGNSNEADAGEVQLISFKSGERGNMVPEKAVAVIKGNVDHLILEFEGFCNEKGLKRKINHNENEVEITLFGVSAHGMEPHIGLNAGTTLASFLRAFDFTGGAAEYLDFLDELHEDYEGSSLDISYRDDVTGPLTVNPGILHFEQAEGGNVHLNIRCPVTTDFEETKNKLTLNITDKGFHVEEIKESQPHHVGAEHPMIAALQEAYQGEANLEPTLLSTGGATYARFMENGVAFGASFPGKEMTAHQKDEYIEVEDLLKAAAIYARAIYNLAK
jgi:succinyl-diaminopimelate desuccinylase